MSRLACLVFLFGTYSILADQPGVNCWEEAATGGIAAHWKEGKRISCSQPYDLPETVSPDAPAKLAELRRAFDAYCVNRGMEGVCEAPSQFPSWNFNPKQTPDKIFSQVCGCESGLKLARLPSDAEFNVCNTQVLEAPRVIAFDPFTCHVANSIRILQLVDFEDRQKASCPVSREVSEKEQDLYDAVLAQCQNLGFF